MQKARGHPKAPSDCKCTVSGSISPRYSRYFSPFPHGTCSLSVSQEYLALPDGPGRFKQDYSCPALLRIPLTPVLILSTRLSLSMVTLPKVFLYNHLCILWSYNPNNAETSLVWANSVSLAATQEITIVFFSYGYLDVSVPHVRPLAGDMSSTCRVAPFRNPWIIG